MKKNPYRFLAFASTALLTVFTGMSPLAAQGAASPPAPLIAPAPAPASPTTPSPAPLTVPAPAPETAPAASPAVPRQTPGPAEPSYYNTRGGDSYQTAVLPPIGQDLKLNHHQKRGEYDYFLVDLKAGQSLKASLSVGDKGIEFRPDNTTVETNYAFAGLVAYDAAGNQLGILDFAGGEKNLQKTLEIDASTPQRIYLLVGSGAQAMHKDYVGFRVDIQDKFDADGLGEAGATLETALALKVSDPGKVYEKNQLTRNDEADFFKIATTPGGTMAIEIVPKNPKTTVNAALYDELRVELVRDRSSSPGAPLKLSAKTNTSTTYLKVTKELSDEPTEYTLSFLPPPPETRPAPETRPLTPTAVVPPAPAAPVDGMAVPSTAEEAGGDRRAERERKVEEAREKRGARESGKEKKPAAKAWWKNTKTLIWGGAGAVGALVLLLGGLILLRKSKQKNEGAEPPPSQP